MSSKHEIQQIEQQYGLPPLTRPKSGDNKAAVLARRNPDGGERLIMIPVIDQPKAAPANRPSGPLIHYEEKTKMTEGAINLQAQTHKLAHGAIKKFVGVVNSILENPPPLKTTEITTRSTGGVWGLIRGKTTVKEAINEPVFPSVKLEIIEQPIEMSLRRIQTFGNTRITEHPGGVTETVIEAPVQQKRQASYISSNIQENGQKYSASTEGTRFVDESFERAGYIQETIEVNGPSVEITFTYE